MAKKNLELIPPLQKINMATLYTQDLQIDELTGMPHDIRLTATVRVELNRIERWLLKSGEVDFILQSSV
jgi:hypothetical protein